MSSFIQSIGLSNRSDQTNVLKQLENRDEIKIYYPSKISSAHFYIHIIKTKGISYFNEDIINGGLDTEWLEWARTKEGRKWLDWVQEMDYLRANNKKDK
jgi:hypothetical protein